MTALGSPEDGTVVSARGTSRLGPYRLISPLGEGGMGLVHLALDPNGRAVAIKVLRSHVAADADARLRMEREFRTLSRIRDPWVAAVIDADVFGDRPYLVTRYIPGPSLDEVVRTSGRLRGPDLLRLGRGLAGALAAIHAVGVVHRDLKPANVLIHDGEPVVIDFGIAHMLDDSRITMTGLVMGTPGYLSPEVVQGAAVTEATDWWGFAATLAYAASGNPPFGRGPMAGVLDRVRRGEFDLSGVDPRLAPLLAAALAPDASRRPHHAEVVAALEQYAHGEAVTVALGPAAVSGATGPVPSYPRTRPMPVQPTREWTGPEVWPPPVPAAQAPAHPPPPGPGSGMPGVSGERPGSVAPDPWPRPRDGSWEREGPPGPAADVGPPRPAADVDPRASRDPRRGTLAAAFVALVGLAATWPGLVVGFVLLWRWVAGIAEHVLTSHGARRHELGRRGSDIPVAVAKSPWHALVAAVGAALSLFVAGMVAFGTVFTTAFVVEAGLGQPLAPTSSVPLAAGAVVLLVMLWWGPGGQAMRGGSRSLVRGMVPSGSATDLVATALALVGAGLGVWAYLRGGQVTWWPFAGLAASLGLG